ESTLMTTAPWHFTGIDGDTGEYLTPPMTPEEITRIALGMPTDPAHQRELQSRIDRGKPHLGVIAGVDTRKLSEAGWGVVFARDADPAVYEALSPLLDHRRDQAGAKEAEAYME